MVARRTFHSQIPQEQDSSRMFPKTVDCAKFGAWQFRRLYLQKLQIFQIGKHCSRQKFNRVVIQIPETNIFTRPGPNLSKFGER